MTEREQTILHEALKAQNQTIVKGFITSLIIGTLTASGLYYGLRAEMREGYHKDVSQDVRMTTIETKLSEKAWRSEVDNLHQRVILNERVFESIKK